MTFRLLALSIAIAITFISGCASTPPAKKQGEKERRPAVQVEPADAPLAAGLDLYAAGQYAEAEKNLNLALSQSLTNPQRIVAHKYLAFVYCTSKRPRQCRAEFAKALKIDPALELEPAEAGHPTWGPVFKEAKKNTRRQ